MDATYAITGALTAKLNGQRMIKKNEIYFYEFYCLDNNKYITEIVIALQDEFPIPFTAPPPSYTYNEVLQDVVNILFRNTVKTVLITELYEIGT